MNPRHPSPRRRASALASLAALLVASPASAQTFQRVLGTSGVERATWAAAPTTGGFVLVGEASNGTLLAALGADGSVAWARALQGTAAARIVVEPNAIVLAADSNVPGDPNGLTWTRVDLLGGLVAARGYPGTAAPQDGHGPALARSAGGYLLGGARALAPSIPLSPEVVVLDLGGHVLAVRNYDDLRYGGTTRGEFSDVAFAGSDALVAGSTAVDGELTTRDTLVARLAGDGDPIWARSFGTAGAEDRALGLELCANGEVAVCGADGSVAGGGAFVLRLDGAGQLAWRVELPGFAASCSIEERADGALFIAGASGGHAALALLDAQGALVWARAYPAGAAGVGAVVVPLADGGAFLAGTIASTSGGGGDVLALRTDPLGRVGCADVDLALAAVSAPRAAANVPLVLQEEQAEHPRATEGVTHELVEASACALQRVRATCAGDGTLATPCPCGNSGAAGRGCANSVEPAGAALAWSGDPAADSLTLDASGLPALASAGVLFFQGDALDADGVVFGDGVRCASGALVRIGAKAAPGGVASYPAAGDPALSTRGGVQPGSGELRGYQAYYRNAAAAFCPPATFNATNALRVLW
ncbi:MAG: PQQ-like beta-propeller repeat protein [Planctomycetes bacterium]|nr:PQQ-like beta-propeller repeat protein [Planctomycetota bacterium]